MGDGSEPGTLVRAGVTAAVGKGRGASDPDGAADVADVDDAPVVAVGAGEALCTAIAVGLDVT